MLLAHGFEQVRQKGSHVIMQKYLNLYNKCNTS
ncbi:MAG: hypothetical protein CVV13_11890 [Gammaproteobacteria bacterium HGW-Gammaproteobacteria-3]|nr:MAG: hypothetical protein CVV13_11890 [Gammaproteobacteria bacterium HGW-Gammaproteobacteria-3]